jgi:hypothetical protein
MTPRGREDKRASILRTIILLVIIFIVGAIAVVRLSEGDSGNPEDPAVAQLAECLTQKGAKMYGAYWCTHCVKQKKAFGSAVSKIDYVECAVTGNPQEQTQPCKDAGVTSYPTWTFADGSRLSGELTFKQLADKAGCAYAGK